MENLIIKSANHTFRVRANVLRFLHMKNIITDKALGLLAMQAPTSVTKFAASSPFLVLKRDLQPR